MSGVFDSIVSELVGSTPKLPYPHAEQLVNRAWRSICDFRWWSWQYITTGQIFQPAQISVGSASATYGSKVVTVNSVAAAALNAVPIYTPVASQYIGQGMQIRLNYSASTNLATQAQYGPYYSIVAWDTVNTITLDRPFGEPAIAGSPFQVLKAYYSAPSITGVSTSVPDVGFKRYDSLVNVPNGYTIDGRRLQFSQKWLNQMDPQRGGTDTPYILAYLTRNSLGEPVHEWYPAPVLENTWVCSYWSKWPDLSSQLDPPEVSYALNDLIKFKAEEYICNWAARNVIAFPELGRVNWIALEQSAKVNTRECLITCVKEDDEIKPQLPFRQGRVIDFPVGGEFLQNHDLSGVIGN